MKKTAFSISTKKAGLCFLAIPLFLSVGTTDAARPFVTDDAGTVDREKYETELSVSYGNNFTLAGLTLQHGFTDRADIEFTLGYAARQGNECPYSPAGLMFKFGFIPNLLAATLGITFGETWYCTNIITSKTIGAFSGNINVGYTTEADANDAEITYGLDIVYTIGKYGIGAEIFGTPEMVNWQIGLNIALQDWLIIDSAVGATIKASPLFQATSGLWLAF